MDRITAAGIGRKTKKVTVWHLWWFAPSRPCPQLQEQPRCLVLLLEQVPATAAHLLPLSRAGPVGWDFTLPKV